jgi:hypothetical protein
LLRRSKREAQSDWWGWNRIANGDKRNVEPQPRKPKKPYSHLSTLPIDPVKESLHEYEIRSLYGISLHSDTFPIAKLDHHFTYELTQLLSFLYARQLL